MSKGKVGFRGWSISEFFHVLFLIIYAFIMNLLRTEEAIVWASAVANLCQMCAIGLWESYIQN